MNDIALYIHIPFCKNKCFYCDFASFSGKEKYMLNYIEALSKEINNIKSENIIKTIFIGGGTPTYLSLEGFNILKKSIEKLNINKDVEFTVEGNPGTFTKEKLKFLKDMGVNRLSIGLQAWQNDLLKVLGRIHTVEEFKESYFMARQLGFDNINIDLMFGLPNQNLKMWEETLNEVISLEPEHISCYSLIIEEGTPFFDFYNNKKLNLPSEDLEREMYSTTLKTLKKYGYNQYEISNFSKKNKECRHNLVYWNLNSYVGCGASAHSYINSIRYSNTEDIKDYIDRINKYNSPIVYKSENTLEENMEEFMFLGLRKIEGIKKEEFRKRFSKDVYDVYGGVINKYKSLNMLCENHERIFLNERGIEVSNVIMSEFLLEKS
ncbi:MULTISPECIES: radical SAM family heme chaperone HemW [Clostridium]|uniref:Heme chaperone HemW n=1 Tax=Clostridium faecium TaxID=2762223 RepID=A0ABR8YXA8_9CLOT|nr:MULTISPECIES: radical SAM family heme chaperone HemW [Clostridium]MBD8048814.1 oxygen-independent coproporphyrinogen III oxidase [Clostridium faecium]MDU1348341.1 radical SAM family heme chaperone HemW [Clostridium argentinense]